CATGEPGTYKPAISRITAMARATSPCMITDMSRKGFAMVFPHPLFAGAALLGALCAGALAGLVSGVAPAGPLGAISALMEKIKVWTAVFFSSCFDSLISTFWK